MTTIQVKVIDQNLQILNSPMVASGGLQETSMQFEFCEKWDGLGKTAVFYRDKSNVYNVVLDGENKCIIPDEVMQTAGRIYFGVYGVNESKRKTTFILKYDIVEGAFFEGEEPSEPTPNIYEQIVSNYEAMRQDYENVKKEYINIFDNLADVVADMDAKGFVETNNNEVVRFWVGSEAEHKTANIEENTLELIYDDDLLFISLGALESNPNATDNATLNGINKEGTYCFKYGGTAYLMLVNAKNELLVQSIIYGTRDNLKTFKRVCVIDGANGSWTIEEERNLLHEAPKLYNHYLSLEHDTHTQIWLTVQSTSQRPITTETLKEYLPADRYLDVFGFVQADNIHSNVFALYRYSDVAGAGAGNEYDTVYVNSTGSAMKRIPTLNVVDDIVSPAF